MRALAKDVAQGDESLVVGDLRRSHIVQLGQPVESLANRGKLPLDGRLEQFIRGVRIEVRSTCELGDEIGCPSNVEEVLLDLKPHRA